MRKIPTVSLVAIIFSFLSLLSLFSLHFLSSELDPRWHMVSEYAYGQYKWILTAFFFSWAVSCWCTAWALFPLAKHWVYKVGVFLLFVSGVGAVMGGLFDVRHSLHGLAFALGVPFLPIVAPFLTRYLQRIHKTQTTGASFLSHTSWLSFIFMAVTMMSFMSQMQRAGALNMTTPQLLTTLPEGVNSIIGYANRLLVLSYIGWLIAMNVVVMRMKKK